MDSTFQHSYSDIGQIVFVGFIIIIAGIILIIRDRQKINSYKQAVFLIFLGIISLLFATIGNSLAADRWDKSYIIAFLSLIRLDDGIFFRGFAFFGYLYFLFGFATLLIVKINRIKGKKSN